jgi:hypothetical protein
MLPEDPPLKSSFQLATDAVSLEISGSEAFLRAHLEFLLPYLRRSAGADESVLGPTPEGIAGLRPWWARKVPPGANPSLQDTILLFAYYMRTYRKTVFESEDMRRCFRVMGLEEPRSLLQILGTLKRDQGTLLSAGKRGEYMMNITGIARARELLGEIRGAGSSSSAPGGAGKAGSDARNLFRD